MLGLHAALSEEVDLAAAVGAHLGQELGSEGSVLDLGQDLLHLLAGLGGDEALAGAVVAVLCGVGDLSLIHIYLQLRCPLEAHPHRAHHPADGGVHIL